MINRPYYPVGVQDFEKIRNLNAVYVDKTELIYELTHTSSIVFLSRPRRFGKSLLSSTLQYYFEGRKDLFDGLAMAQLEKDWTVHPVLHFDLSTAKYLELEKVIEKISLQIDDYEELYGRNQKETTLGARMEGLIRRAAQKTGQKAVILIDEYDAPILNVLHADEKLRDGIRFALREFFAPLKACDRYLRFAFITGISTFSQLGIFSELNNLKNISNSKYYATLCGITRQELQDNFRSGIQRLGEVWNCTETDVVEKLTMNYDGYHFCEDTDGLFNPFSLLNAFDTEKMGDYWFQSGTSRYLVEMLKKYAEEGKFDLSMVEEQRNVVASSFSTPIEAMTGALPLLYQSGYLTIKGYDPRTNLYTLDIPNAEVRRVLIDMLRPI